MNESSKTYWTNDPDLVEKYILGQILEEERKILDAEIADCESCREKLRVELDIAAGIKRHGRDQLKSRLSRYVKRNENSQLQRYSYAGLAAAVFLVAIGVGVYKVWFSDISWPTKFKEKTIVFKQSPPANDTLSSLSEKMEDRGIGTENEPVGKKITEGNISSSDKDVTIVEESANGGDRKEAMGSSASKIKKSAQVPPAANQRVRAVIKPFSQKVWLIGSVVMTSNAKSEVSPNIALRKSSADRIQSGAEKKDMAQTKALSITKMEGTQQIVLQQRPLYELPASRRTQLTASRHIETLVEHTEKGLNLIMFNDNLQENDLKNATLELTKGDSLIVTMEDQKIIYRLPGGWNFQEQTLRR
jgi:hypothetical protein